MTLRCFLFASDEATSDVVRHALTALGIEGETCPIATTAVEKVANEPLQLVIIDWDLQPEAGMVLNAARERKAADRPLTIAIVSDDASVPKALQAGANSILRKPLVAAQVTDNLTTARELLRSKFESQKSVQAAAASAGSSSALPAIDTGQEKTLRAGEFLRSAPLNPSNQIVTDTEVPMSPDQSVDEAVDPLKELETVAAAAPPPLPEPDEPKGLEWYLKKKGISRGGAAAAPAPAPAPPDGKPELLGYDQNQSHSAQENSASQGSEAPRKSEPAIFSSYIDEDEQKKLPKKSVTPKFNFPKGPIIAATVLAAIAVSAAPQAPWHPQMKVLWARGQRSLHGWLNPQATTVVTQAPTAHEDFGRAGDEYKLPVAENIPDATTDPSQIQVVPAVDPTKKPTTDTGTPEQSQPTQTPVPTDNTPALSPDGTQPSTAPSQQTPSVQPAPPASSPANPAPAITAPASSVPAVVPGPSTQPHSEPALVPQASVPTPAPQRPQPNQYTPVNTKVPSSLQSQMAVMTPEASGNKPAEAAMPAIEPVDVPELTERALLSDQPAIIYPASAKGQQGTVILQVLIGRDGLVQDAKFLQGSLAFARTAIDGVKQWRFKPYSMNGRPVSVATTLTVKFKPGQ